MNTRPYESSQRSSPALSKLAEINWNFVILITLIACAGFAMLYSAAGGNWSPWADRQIVRFLFGFGLLLAAACVDLRFWVAAAYPAYWISLLLLVAVEIAGHVGLGAQRWLEFGPLALQPSELMKLALVLALARFLHGLKPGEVSQITKICTPAAMKIGRAHV